ncbi:unnamed protein product [Parascedosporium putredinis]|uniref:GPI anchored serine-threonine rich protein n=1 Tax=Parascedosporium putredinis TaxID=1442378 RepID=A0A9P1GXL6_9PEZI|nr:unnamed protein product [Parascedosporium putredinis]CAI7989964.1 unnamed protein product [Parascedosporium putredinis]
MKFFLPLALLAAAVSAAETECAAEVIVQNCLESQTLKFEACGQTDYDCQCAAQEAISTCYNNCPGDSRKLQAEGQVSIYCGNASIYGAKASQKTAVATPTAKGDNNAAETTGTDESEATSTGDAAPADNSPGSAAELARNAGSVLLAVAGVMAVIV